MNVIFGLITVQAILGAIDNLWHHEITERLPSRRNAVPELTLHALRELIYSLVFVGLALFQPLGGWAIFLAVLLATEVVVTLADFVIEDRTRHLPAPERVLHTVLALNYGAVLALLAPVLTRWAGESTALVSTRHVFTWPFVIFGIGVFAWSLRNFTAVLRLRQPPEWVRQPLEIGTTEKPRTVLITGATGFIGGHTVRSLVARGDRVVVLSRRPDVALDRFGPHVRIIKQVDEIDSTTRIHAIINLAGAPILGLPWTKARRRTLLTSRLETTRALVALMGRMSQPAGVLVSASAIGYYGVHGEELIDENGASAPIFQSQLCRRWEEAALCAQSTGTRVVRLRIGLVLGRDGGALPQLMRPARLGLAAVLGGGKHWLSWIHIDDLVRLIEFAVDTPRTTGVLNAVAPRPVTQWQFQRAMTRVLRRPLWLRVPARVLRGAMGEMAQLLVDGQRVLPIRAMSLGFRFHYRTVAGALQDLCVTPAAYTGQAQIYFNGDCPICSAEMTHYARVCSWAKPELQFIDCMQQPDDLARYGLRVEHLERRVYVRDSRGRVLSGFPALLVLWRTMPGYGALARALDMPLIRPLCNTLYDQLVAPGLARWGRRRAAAKPALMVRSPH